MGGGAWERERGGGTDLNEYGTWHKAGARCRKKVRGNEPKYVPKLGSCLGHNDSP